MSHLPSTTAGVRYVQQSDFEDGAPGIQIWLVEMKFDGPTPNGTTEVRFSGTASSAAKRQAVRDVVNNQMKYYEPLTPLLTDAAIQISGQPV